MDGDAAVDALRGAHELQPEAELARVLEVVGLQVLDPFVAHVVEVHGRAEREPREDRHLRCGVAPGDVVAGIGLGIADALCLAERVGVARTLGHLGEDVVGRAVDDSVDALDRRRAERFLEHAHDRHDACDGGLEAEPDTLFTRGLEQLLAVLREQLLVRADDVLAGADRAHQVVARGVDAAHHLDDQVGIREDLREVAARAREHPAEHRAAAVEALDLIGAFVEQRRECAADGAVPEQADAERHRAARASGANGHRAP